MKECTRVTTVEITQIFTVKDESMLLSKEEYSKRIKRNLSPNGYDDILVTKVQDFIREVDA